MPRLRLIVEINAADDTVVRGVLASVVRFLGMLPKGSWKARVEDMDP